MRAGPTLFISLGLRRRKRVKVFIGSGSSRSPESSKPRNLSPLMKETEELIAVLASIILSTKAKKAA